MVKLLEKNVSATTTTFTTTKDIDYINAQKRMMKNYYHSNIQYEIMRTIMRFVTDKIQK